MTPIDARRFARPAGQQCSSVGVYITTAITSSLPITSETTNHFWGKARETHRAIAASRCTSSTIDLAVATKMQLRRDASPAAVANFLRATTDREGALSNLGTFDIDASYGNLRVPDWERENSVY